MYPTWVVVAALAGAGLLAGCRKAAAPARAAAAAGHRADRPNPDHSRRSSSGWPRPPPPKSVQVRSQVSGVIVERPYVEGTDVPKGKVLYRIDPRTYQANYESAKARLAESEAQFANAERTLNRLKPLLEERAVAQQDVDNAQAAYDQSQRGGARCPGRGGRGEEELRRHVRPGRDQRPGRRAP